MKLYIVVAYTDVVTYNVNAFLRKEAAQEFLNSIKHTDFRVGGNTKASECDLFIDEVNLRIKGQHTNA